MIVVMNVGYVEDFHDAAAATQEACGKQDASIC